MECIKRLHLGVAVALCAFAFGSSAQAQDLTYQPISPTFGGNPFNSGHVFSLKSPAEPARSGFGYSQVSRQPISDRHQKCCHSGQRDGGRL